MSLNDKINPNATYFSKDVLLIDDVRKAVKDLLLYTDVLDKEIRTDVVNKIKEIFGKELTA